MGYYSPAEKYIAHHNEAFVVPFRRSLFNTDISKQAPNAVLHKAKAEHAACSNNSTLYNATNNGVINFFRTIVDEMWYQDLKDNDTYHSEVTATDIIAHFRANCSSLREVDVITIQGDMINYFGQAEGISQYINTIEGA